MPLVLTLKQIVNQLGGTLQGDASVEISAVKSLEQSQTGAISFIADAKYLKALAASNASAVVLKPAFAQHTDLPKIICDNPYAYFAKLAALFHPTETPALGVHPSACVHASAVIPATCSIAAGVVIGENVVLGEHVQIGPNSVIERGVQIGAHTKLESCVTVHHACVLGANCHIFSGAVIGADGFGYAPENGAWVKIPQVGRVVIEDNVDIGANTTIDRGALDDTVIETGCKLDNQIHIAHNCRIGAHSVIAGCVGIAGSAVVGKHCRIGGAAMILGHLKIADNVTVSPGSMIMRSITESGTYTAIMPSQSHKEWLKTAANIRQLNQLADKISVLENALTALQQKNGLPG